MTIPTICTAIPKETGEGVPPGADCVQSHFSGRLRTHPCWFFPPGVLLCTSLPTALYCKDSRINQKSFWVCDSVYNVDIADVFVVKKMKFGISEHGSSYDEVAEA